MEEKTAAVDTNFVVYGFYREDWTPFYIGKGRPGRPYQKGGRPCGSPPRDRILILYKNIDEQTAFDWEKKLIKRYGRKEIEPNGLLYNKSLGGEGPSGVVITEERRKQLSDRAKSVTGREHPRTILHNWTHPEHGDHMSISALELIQMYPEQDLKYPNLCKVVKGERLTAKGWKILENKNVTPEERLKVTKKLCTWSHPLYGVYEDLSASELVRIFPELKRQSLNDLANKKILQYEEWVVTKYNTNGYKEAPKKANWFHEEHGIFKNYTIAELCEKFKDLKLNPAALRVVKKSRALQHKGWKILKGDK